jgi:hypothetical protein
LSSRIAALGVLRGHPDPARNCAPEDERHGHPAAGHVPPLAGVVDDLVHHEGDEVRDLELDDGPAADQGRSDARTGLGGLRDRRVDHTSRPKLLEQPRRDLE